MSARLRDRDGKGYRDRATEKETEREVDRQRDRDRGVVIGIHQCFDLFHYNRKGSSEY